MRATKRHMRPRFRAVAVFHRARSGCLCLAGTVSVRRLGRRGQVLRWLPQCAGLGFSLIRQGWMQMSTQPLVSVVVTLYNKAPYVRRAIQSILRQSYQDYEIVVIDDGSTDGGADIVARLQEPRLRLVHQENQGEGAARNRGIRDSVAPLIAMLDADDEWEPGFLAAIVDLYAAFPDAGIYATGYRCLYRGGLEVERTLVPESGTQTLVRDYFRRARFADFFVWSSAQAVPRQVYEQIGPFAEGVVGTDRDMWGRIALKHTIAYDTRILASYHTEASTVVRQFARRVQMPPFVLTARRAMDHGEVSSEVLPDLREYLNKMLLQNTLRVVGTGDRRELRRVLYEELYPTSHYRCEVAFLKIASAVCPMRLLYLLYRVCNSRWVSGRRFRRSTAQGYGVIERFRSAPSPGAFMEG